MGIDNGDSMGYRLSILSSGIYSVLYISNQG